MPKDEKYLLYRVGVTLGTAMPWNNVSTQTLLQGFAESQRAFLLLSSNVLQCFIRSVLSQYLWISLSWHCCQCCK